MSKKSKTFWVVSALRCDSSQLGHLVRHESEVDAIEHAKYVIGQRALEGKSQIAFYILKVTAQIAPSAVPVKLMRFK